MAESNSCKFLLTSVKDGCRIITLNKPKRKNAFCQEMYLKLTTILNEDAKRDNVVVTILTGYGEYYSSGNDISAGSGDDVEYTTNVIKELMEAFINYPKLLIAVVNGPAIGVAVTTLALCDVVYASDRATFCTPFVDLALCPEGCSSYLFPQILGKSKASEMLLLGHKMNAQEAFQFGLVSAVIPHLKLGEVFEKVKQYGKLNVKVIKRTKQMLNVHSIDMLHKVNQFECKKLIECLNSEELVEAITKFLLRKNKL